MKAPRTVAIDLYARRGYPWLDAVTSAAPGLVLLDERSGCRVRVLEDGSVAEITPGGYPHAGAASDPANVRAPA